jgi:hypothetical protein
MLPKTNSFQDVTNSGTSPTVSNIAKKQYIRDLTRDTHDKPLEHILKYGPEEFPRNITIPPLYVEAGDALEISIKTQKQGTLSPISSIDKNIYRIMELEKLLDLTESKNLKLQKDNEALLNRISNLIIKSEEEVSNMHLQKLIQRRNNIENAGIYTGFFISVLILLISLLLKIPITAVLPGGLLFISLSGFFMLKRSVRRKHDHD